MFQRWYDQTEALTVSQTATCQQSNYCCHPLVITSRWGGGKQGQIWLGRAAGGGGAAQQQEQEEEEKEEEQEEEEEEQEERRQGRGGKMDWGPNNQTDIAPSGGRR